MAQTTKEIARPGGGAQKRRHDETGTAAELFRLVKRPRDEHFYDVTLELREAPSTHEAGDDPSDLDDGVEVAPRTRTLRLHRHMLCRAEFFALMFKGKMAEASYDRDRPVRVGLPEGVTLEHAVHYIDLLYADTDASIDLPGKGLSDGAELAASLYVLTDAWRGLEYSEESAESFLRRHADDGDPEVATDVVLAFSRLAVLNERLRRAVESATTTLLGSNRLNGRGGLKRTLIRNYRGCVSVHCFSDWVARELSFRWLECVIPEDEAAFNESARILRTGADAKSPSYYSTMSKTFEIEDLLPAFARRDVPARGVLDGVFFGVVLDRLDRGFVDARLAEEVCLAFEARSEEPFEVSEEGFARMDALLDRLSSCSEEIPLSTERRERMRRLWRLLSRGTNPRFTRERRGRERISAVDVALGDTPSHVLCIYVPNRELGSVSPCPSPIVFFFVDYYLQVSIRDWSRASSRGFWIWDFTHDVDSKVMHPPSQLFDPARSEWATLSQLGKKRFDSKQRFDFASFRTDDGGMAVFYFLLAVSHAGSDDDKKDEANAQCLGEREAAVYDSDPLRIKTYLAMRRWCLCK